MSVCTAITQGGSRCKGVAIDSSGYCHAHHPDRAEQRSRAARKGGQRGGRGRPQVELNHLKAEVQEVIEAVRSGELDRSIGGVLFQGYNTLLKAHAVALDVQERLELLPRLEEIEERMQEKGRKQWGA